MRAVPAWVDKVHDRDKVEQCIYDLCFNPDGTQLVVAAGQRVLVYDTNDGSLIQPLKGHKDTVYCVGYAKDGKRFASGSADKNVIIWTSKLEGVLKYSHNDAIQCLAYNPISHHLASCAVSDFAFWSPEQKAVQKHKSGARINACAWTNDGQYLALGLATGVVSLRGKGGDERGRIEPPDSAPISALAWSPDTSQVLCVATWGQKLAFYAMNGKLVGKERAPGGDPLCAGYLRNGEYLLVGGTDRRCSLMTRDGIRLGTIGDTHASWVWCCAARPDSAFVAVGCQDGTIAYYQLAFSTVHGLYKERYAFRENMTDVIIQHLLTDQKVRIKCRDLIKKIAIYKNRLAVQLPERVVIYELYAGDTEGMHYRVKEKINQRLECNLLVVCSNHLVLCLEKKLQCIAFDGTLEREWLMDSPIRYIKVIGGPESREGLLLGLKNGQVCKIFLDNAFPVSLLKIASSIRCLDVSPRRKRLAIVDENNQCLVYDIATQELLYQEPNANSVAWNAHFEEMLCFSGNDLLSIKASSFPVHQQKLLGFVVGFCGAKVFCLHVAAMTAVEVPLSTPMYQYLEKKQFQSAYRVACMGVPGGDWQALAMAALEGLDLDTAQRALRHTKDLKLLELLAGFQRRSRGGDTDPDSLRAELLAQQGRFREAAQLFKRCHREQQALAMYTDLRMFDHAQEFLGSADSAEQRQLLRKRAQWAQDVGEPRAAAEMLFSAGDVTAAVDLAGANGWTDLLCDLAGRLDAAQTEALSAAAGHLRRLGLSAEAAAAFTRLGDARAVAAVLVGAGEWEQAFALAQRQPDLRDAVFVPYAHFLAENDRFAEAQAAFHRAGRSAEAFEVLDTLTENAVAECRFLDAGYYHWLLARQCLDLARENQGQRVELLSRYRRHDSMASVYYAFEPIQRYIDEPFTTYMAEGLFNIARFLLNETKDQRPAGISQFAVMYTLAKQARNLGAYKLAHELLARMQGLVVPPQFQDSVDLATMTIKAKPYSDSEELLPMCYRCSTFNQLLSKSGNACSNCRQPFVHSFASFEITPLVEFRLEPDISPEEALRLVEAEPGAPAEQPGWRQSVGDGFQALKLDDATADDDAFTARLMDFESVTDEFVPVTVDRGILRGMDASSVLVCRWPEPLNWRFYRNILPDLQITLCNSCFRTFYLEDFELQVLEKGHCPFCRTPQMDADPAAVANFAQ